MILYGTLGGSCLEKETVRALFRAGMTGARLNLSHGPLETFAPALSGFWSAAAEEGVRPRLVIDLQGPELRVGRLSRPAALTEGGRAVLVRDGTRTPSAPEAVPALETIPVPEAVLESVRPGDRVSLDDSALLLEVLERLESGLEADGGAVCRVLRGGTLLGRKSLAVLGKTVPRPPLTAEDVENLSQAGRFGVTDILQPFVRGLSDVEALRAALVRAGLPDVRIMAKIENRQGLDRLEEIAASADELCIARGDLGNGLPLWEVPRYQKRIAAHCRAVGRPFCVATQLLWSMRERSVPTRAEMCDIYNAVLDGASGLMLTGETAAGRYPAEAMAYLFRAARTAMEDMGAF